MGLRLGFLETAVARRMLVHFLSASLLPAMLVSVAGVWFVRRTLTSESEDRVARSAKAASLVLMGRLTARAAEFSVAPDTTGTVGEAARAGGISIRVESPRGPDQDAQVRLVRGIGQADSSVVRLQNSFFWTPIEELLESEYAEYCVFAVGAWERVRCTDGLPPAVVHAMRDLAKVDRGGSVQRLGDSLMSAQNDLYLRDAFAAASWRLVVTEPTDEVRAANRAFTLTLIVLLAIGAVTAFVFAHRQLRVATEPLRVLRDATRRIREGDLDAPLRIASGDEFRELGEALSTLKGALGDQVRLLRQLDAIDAAALADREAEGIVARATQALIDTDAWEAVTVGYIPADAPDTLVTTTATAPHAPHRLARRPLNTDERHALLSEASTTRAVTEPTNRGTLIRLPLLHQSELLGSIVLQPRRGSQEPTTALRPGGSSALSDAVRLADRVSLALGNVHLLGQLEALSAGTLRAFARTIDANSPWTAGHSERVTHLAIAIGRALDLDDADLGRLYRGGLLHDIGKVAVPPEVLDKPGRLTDAERAVVERHPGVGYDILSPIAAFADVLPIVRSHHERPDGTGYPDRLRGDAVPWLARVLAVADVYDALTSDRPYRAGMPRERAIVILEEGRGTQFDPRVIDAFLTLGYAAADHDISADLATQTAALESAAAEEQPLPL